MRRNIYFIVSILALSLIAGCGTVPKQFKAEVSDIKTRVDTLETRVDSVEAKTSDAERAAMEQARVLDEVRARSEKQATTNISVKRSSGSKSREGIRDIQTSLKNAGFYNGKIDGIKGRQTRSAIKEFQSANGLKADGVVGPKTREALSRYSSGAAQPTGAGTEEGPVTK